MTTTLATADGPMALHTATPEGPPRGAVVVLQEAFGVNAYIEGVAADLARQGYLAVAPNLYHRTADEPIPYGDHARVLPHIAGLSDPGFLVDLDATTAHLTGLGFAPGSIGVVGFCIGGRMAFLAAASRPLGASVGFYGGGIVTAADRFAERLPSLLGRAGSLRTPWLGLFGEQDHTIPAADVDALAAALEGGPVAGDVIRFAAGHAFHCPDRSSYEPTAAAEGWDRALGWFDRFLGA